MKVVVTGATGFVGSAVVRALVARGDKVTAVTRPGSDRKRLAGTEVAWATADITDPATLTHLFDGTQAVVHAAGQLGAFGISEATLNETHIEGTRNVCLALEALPEPPRLLHISSPGVLGPISGSPATETAPLAPSNAYERSKAAAENVALSFAERGLPLVVARPEFIYGPGDMHVLGLFQAIRAGRFFYVGDGRNTCHPTFIGDAVEGLLRALDHGRDGAVYHIAGPQPVSFRELATTIAAALDVPPPRLAIPVPIAMTGAAALEMVGRLTGIQPPLSRSGVAFFSEDRRFSRSKAERELNFVPRVALPEGVAHAVAWYREQEYL